MTQPPNAGDEGKESWGGPPPPQGPDGYPQTPGGYPQAPGGYPQAPGGYPAAPGGYPAAPGGYGAPQAPMPQTWLVPAILATLLCFTPTGVAAIVFASQTSSKYNRGDLAGAQQASSRARLLVLASAGIGLVVTVVYVIYLASKGTSGS